MVHYIPLGYFSPSKTCNLFFSELLHGNLYWGVRLVGELIKPGSAHWGCFYAKNLFIIFLVSFPLQIVLFPRKKLYHLRRFLSPKWTTFIRNLHTSGVAPLTDDRREERWGKCMGSCDCGCRGPFAPAPAPPPPRAPWYVWCMW